MSEKHDPAIVGDQTVEGRTPDEPFGPPARPAHDVGAYQHASGAERLVEGDEPRMEDVGELPPRERRQLLTPLTGGLVALLLAACGFVAGVLVEKGQVRSTFTAIAARRAGTGSAVGFGQSRASSGLGGGARPFGGGGRNATVGQVSTLQGRTLYVTTAGGNTVKVTVPSGEKIDRTLSANVDAIHPGDLVVVQGNHARDGTVTATSVRATAAGAQSAAGGLQGLFGAGSTGGGAGSAPSGAGRGGGGAGGSGSPLFGSGG